MKKLGLILLATASISCSSQATADKSPAPNAAAEQDVAAWERQARNVTIIRDDWGIAHVYGKTDADAVFGLMYAQAEDDFNRVETNYLNSMGRLAEAEGEGEVYRDLRMKLFIDPDDMKAQYQKSPEWLKSLMNAWADGLNYYLHKHPEVKPRVITRFEPWMALTFSEGSIGGDIERVNLKELEAFYGNGPRTAVQGGGDRSRRPAEPTGSNGIAIAPSNTASKRALLLINPHTSFFFRSEAQMVSDEGLERLRRVDLGPVLHLPGLQRARRLDAHLERCRQHRRVSGNDREERRRLLLPLRHRRAPGHRRARSPCRTRAAPAMARKDFTIYRTHHGPIVREADGKWVSVRLMQEPLKALTQSYIAHQGEELQGVPRDDGAAHQLVEQHHLRRRRRHHRLLPLQLHPEARRQVRLDQTGRRQRSRDRMERRACPSTRRPG